MTELRVEKRTDVTGRGPVFTGVVTQGSGWIETPFRIQWDDSEGKPRTGFCRGVEAFSTLLSKPTVKGNRYSWLIRDGSDTIEPGTVIRTI